MKACSVDGCDGPTRTRGMCHKHYQRFRRNGDPVAVPERRKRAKKPKEPCSVEGCEVPIHSRGMCQRHYRRMTRHGDPHATATGGGKGRTWSPEEREARMRSRTEGVPPRELSEVTTWRGAHARAKTHCRSGHEFTPENTYVSPRGHRACRLCREASRVKVAYGLDAEAVKAMMTEQGGGCAICSMPFTETTACVDHCHDTGAVRGLLCGECNTGLGKFKDSPEVLLAAAQYLESSETN